MADDSEQLDEYRLMARKWLRENMPLRPEGWRPEGTRSDESVARARELLSLLASGGFSGITWPTEYGGQGLTARHERIFNEEAAEYEMPQFFGSTLRKIAVTLIEHGSEAQKLRYLPKIMCGQELWAQYLSEPSGGSDLAGAITSATRDGDEWILNGSKIWTTGGYWADYAMCLARTDWDVPKHQGLSMFILPIHCPGVTVVPITQVSGGSEFAQEFLDDVRIPAENLVGQLNAGWTVARTLLVHERNAFAVTPAGGGIGTRRGLDEALVALATRRGTLENAHTRQLLAEAQINETVTGQLARRVVAGQRSGEMPGPAGSLIKLSIAGTVIRHSDIAMEIGGPLTIADADEVPALGVRFIGRQGVAIGGGTNEMQRNTIGEKLLGLPRDVQNDDVPFRQVRTNRLSSKPGDGQ
jgi:alkylation response protein AidB-like acyl-CoA dehydrogenase